MYEDLGQLLEAARRAVADASRVCARVQAQLEEARSSLKDDRSPVTIADWASQAVVARSLRDSLGDVRIVGEEDSDALRREDHRAHRRLALDAARLVWEDATEDDLLAAVDLGGGGAENASPEGFWTLDPIDGTKGFLRGGQYAVSLAWVVAGRPRVGVLGCPNVPFDHARPLDAPDGAGTQFHAVQGGGAHECPGAGETAEGTRLAPERFEREGVARICESVEAAHTAHGRTHRILDAMGGRWESVRLDSQAKYAIVARGQADAYLRLPVKKGYVERIWDHAAGALIAEEAGRRVTDALGSELDFGHGVGLAKNTGVACSSARLHDRLVEAITATAPGAEAAS